MAGRVVPMRVGDTELLVETTPGGLGTNISCRLPQQSKRHVR